MITPTTLLSQKNCQWRSVFCKQMPSQTLDGSTYPSYEFGGKFKNSDFFNIFKFEF